MAKVHPRTAASLARIAKKQRAANAKVRRNVAKGVTNLPGSEYDPRRDLREIRGLNAKGRAQYERSLDRFLGRNNQFEVGAKGRPIPRSVWQGYANLEQAHNARVDAHEAAIRELQLPGQSGTVGSRIQQMTPDDKFARQANSNYRTLQKIRRTPAMFEDVDKLKRVMDVMSGKSKKNYVQEDLDKKMNSARALLTGSQMEDFIPQLEGMSPGALDLLLNYSTFGDIASDRFASGTDDEESRDENDRDYEIRNSGGSREADNADAMQSVIDWAIANGDRDSFSVNPSPARNRSARRSK